jgi:dolichol-phosphate mannosyltransferase
MSDPVTNPPAVSVIVPVRNEAGNIAPLVAEIAVALSGRRFEVIYVNDGSTDGTEAERIPGCASSSTRSPAARRRRCEPACAPRADTSLS